MIRIALALALSVTSADAHCFRVWHYRTPQRCWAGAMRAAPAVRTDKSWYVEIASPPLSEREIAIEKLKAELRGANNAAQ